MMYKAMYKCRLCGEEYSGLGVNGEYRAEVAVRDFIDGGLIISDDGTEIRPKELHSCKCGSIGYADFLGFKMEG